MTSPSSPSQILLIDPSAGSRTETSERLQIAFPEATIVAAETDQPSAEPYDLVVTESGWPGARGAEVVRRLLARDPRRPVVVLTGHGDEMMAAEMMRAGAADYLPRTEAGLRRLPAAVRQAWEEAGRRREQAAGAQEAGPVPEASQRARELAIIHQVAMATASVLDLDELLHQTTRVIVSTLYPDVFGFVLWDEATDTFRAHPSYHGIPPAGYDIAVPLEESIAGKVVRTGRPQIVDDVAQAPDYFQIVAETRSEITVPVHVGGRVIGVINAESARLRAFSEDDLRFLTTLAGQVASAIERTQLYSDLQENAAQLAVEVAARTVELQEERDRMLAILEGAGEGILFTDCQGKIQYVNPAMERQTGYTRDECLGRDARLWYREEFGRKAYARMRKAVMAGERWSGEVACWRKDLSVFDAAVTVSPLYGEQGELTGYVTIQADISQVKEIERLKSKFVANVSHELRTPLTNIKTYVSLLERGQLEKRERYVEVIRWETERLERLIQDLLDLSQLDASEGRLALRPLNLSQMVDRLVRAFGARTKRKGISVRVSLPAGLPMVMADEERLQQVLQNLLANALAYTPSGGQVWIEGGWDSRQAGMPTVWLRMKDNGLGIAADEVPLLFDRFYRGSAAQSSNEPGTGLGLAICKEILARHGGRIEVEPTNGTGAAFRIWLVAARAEDGVNGR